MQIQMKILKCLRFQLSQVIFNTRWETGHSGVQWHVATYREKQGQVAADDGQDDQEGFIHPYIRRLEEGTAREEGAIF